MLCADILCEWDGVNKQKVNFTLYLKNAFASLYINDDSDYINQNQAGWSLFKYFKWQY